MQGAFPASPRVRRRSRFDRNYCRDDDLAPLGPLDDGEGLIKRIGHVDDRELAQYADVTNVDAQGKWVSPG